MSEGMVRLFSSGILVLYFYIGRTGKFLYSNVFFAAALFNTVIPICITRKRGYIYIGIGIFKLKDN